MVRVAVYSDQPVLAKGLESLIAADPALESSASCSKVAVLKKHLANENPDLAVLDLTPEITSAALNELQKLAPESKLILWTNTIAGDFALQALTIGIRGVLRKTLPLEAHRQCLHRVYSGDLWFEKSLMDSLRAGRSEDYPSGSFRTKGRRNKLCANIAGAPPRATSCEGRRGYRWSAPAARNRRQSCRPQDQLRFRRQVLQFVKRGRRDFRCQVQHGQIGVFVCQMLFQHGYFRATGA